MHVFYTFPCLCPYNCVIKTYNVRTYVHFFLSLWDFIQKKEKWADKIITCEKQRKHEKVMFSRLYGVKFEYYEISMNEKCINSIFVTQLEFTKKHIFHCSAEEYLKCNYSLCLCRSVKRNILFSGLAYIPYKESYNIISYCKKKKKKKIFFVHLIALTGPGR